VIAKTTTARAAASGQVGVSGLTSSLAGVKGSAGKQATTKKKGKAATKKSRCATVTAATLGGSANTSGLSLSSMENRAESALPYAVLFALAGLLVIGLAPFVERLRNRYLGGPPPKPAG